MTKLRLYPLVLLAVFTLFMGFPLSHVLLQAFFVNGQPSLLFFRSMIETEFYREAVFNSLNLAIAVTLLATLLAYPLAFLLGRYRIPGATLIHSLLLLPLVVPPFVGVLGVRQLFSRFGTVNVLLLDLGIIDQPVRWLGGGGVAGIIALQVVHLVPILYLTLRASLANTHQALEEAALMSGASRGEVIRRIVIPMSFPGWFAGATLVFIGSFTDLGTPLIFEYRKTVPVQIFNMLTDLNENPVGYSFVVFTCFLSVLLFMFSKASFSAGSYASSARIATTSTLRPLPNALSRTCAGLALAYALLGLIPQATLVTLSLSAEWFMTALPASWTGRHFVEVLQHPITAKSLFTSLWLSATASALTAIVGFLTAYIVVRWRGPTRALFEALSIVPLAVPGIVFAFGYAGAFAGTPLDNRINPFPLLIAAYVIRRLPAMVRSAAAGLEEANQALEEAGLMAGASPLQVTRKILFPLTARHLAVGAILTFAYSMIEVSDGLLLALEERFYPVSKAIYALMGRPDGLELAAALGSIVMLIMVVAFYATEVLSGRGKTKLLGLAVGLLVLPCSLAHAEPDEVVVVSAHWEGMKREFEWAFTESYRKKTGREVRVRWLDLGGVSDIVKYLKGRFRSDPASLGVDVMFAGGTDVFLDLEREGLLAPTAVSPAILSRIPQQLGGSPLYSHNGSWFAAALSTFGIVFNRPALQRLHLPEPTSWADLAKPEYFDLVGAGDPRKSGSMHAMYEIILQGYGWRDGWRLIEQIGSNVRNFSGGASQIGKDVATAEMALGLAIDSYGLDLLRRYGSERIGFAVPTDLPAVNGDGIAILRNAPHPDVAREFLEFVLSEAGQKIFFTKIGVPGGPVRYEIGKFSVMPDLYGKVPAATVVQINPFAMRGLVPSRADLAATRWSLVNDIFGAFIIDAHDSLVSRCRASSAGEGCLRGVPVTEEQAGQLLAAGAWGADPALRGKMLREWGNAARSGSVGFVARVAWIPSALFGFALLLAAGRSLRKALR